MKQVSVRVTDEIHQQLKEKTVKEKTTVQAVMDSFIAVYLDYDISINDLLKAAIKIHQNNRN